MVVRHAFFLSDVIQLLIESINNEIHINMCSEIFSFSSKTTI